MATLTDAAVFSKKLINLFAISLGTIVILFVILRYGNIVKSALFPPPPPPSTVAFGQIPPLDLSEGIKPSPSIAYSIETISGGLPSLPHEAKVFSTSLDKSTFGALEYTKMKVAKINFSQGPIEIPGNIAKFIDSREPGRNITINIDTGNFKLDSNFRNNPDVIASRPKSTEQAIETAWDFLREMDINELEYPKEKAETLNFRIENGQLVEVPALSLANVVQVNFIRGDIDKMPVITPRHREAYVKVIVSAREVVAADVERTSVQKFKFATYPLKDIKKAFAELKSGKGAFNKEPEGSRFPIRDVILGYLDTKVPQGFFQPVYVFKSDHGRIAYVGAVDDSWTSGNSQGKQ